MGQKRRQKRQKLDMAVATIHRRFGPRALVRGAAAVSYSGVAAACIPTGFPALDRILGIGGLPRGKVCELVGPATSGKTTLALKFLAQAQSLAQAQGLAKAQGLGGTAGQVAYVDQALYFDPDYAHRCGVDLSRLVVGAPQDLSEALAMTEALARNGGLSALVFDTLDFLWDEPVAAGLLAATLNRLPGFLAPANTSLLVLHDSTSTITSGSPALSALAHAAAVRLHVIRERWLRRHDDVRGYEARVEVIKNRMGPSGRAATITIEFNGTVRGNGL